jgi:DNA-binding MarR family transcriptional regulator
VISRLIRRLRAEHTFSISHAAVLSRLEREGTRTASALAVAERVRPQSMAQTITELAGDRLVTRRPDPHDRRQTLIELTDLGRDTLARERAHREGWLATAITDGLSEDEQEILARAIPLLSRIADM